MRRAQVCELSAAATLVQSAEAGVLTSCGRSWSPVLPRPSSPALFTPQHHSVV